MRSSSTQQRTRGGRPPPSLPASARSTTKAAAASLPRTEGGGAPALGETTHAMASTFPTRGIPRKPQHPMPAGAASLRTTSTIGSGKTLGKLIPGSKLGAARRGKGPQPQPFQRTATGSGSRSSVSAVAACPTTTTHGGAGPRGASSTQGLSGSNRGAVGSHPSSSVASVPSARRPISGVLPRLSSASGAARVSSISVVSTREVRSPSEEAALEPAPAYLLGTSTRSSTGAAQASSARQPFSLPTSARPRSAFNATLTLSGRRRHSGSEGPPGPSPGGEPQNPRDGGAQMAGTTYVVGNAVVNPFVAVSPAVQQCVRGVTASVGPGTTALPRASPQRPSTALAALPVDPAAAQRRAVGAIIVPSQGPAATHGPSDTSVGGGASSNYLLESAEASVPKGVAADTDTRRSPVSTSSEVPNMPNFALVPAVRSRPKAGPFLPGDDQLLGVMPTQEDAAKQQTLFCLEGISTRKHGSASQAGGTAAPSAAVQQLKALYGTTPDDVPARMHPSQSLAGGFGDASTSYMQVSATVTPATVSRAKGGRLDGGDGKHKPLDGVSPITVACDVLPELQFAEARSAELAGIRRRIDWDVAIPSTDHGAPPPLPAIAFLDAEGNPVTAFNKVHYTFNTATLTMERDVDEDMRRLAHHHAPSNGSTHSNTASGTHGQPASFAASKMAAAVRSVGQSFSQGSATPSLFRFHRLVGLMKGLAEKVGLERVMEYQVTCETDSVMLLSAPYVDADVGDLVVHLNPSLLGSVRLTVTGFDCAAVDPTSGALAESSNVLTVVVQCTHAPLTEGNWLVVTAPTTEVGDGTDAEAVAPTAEGQRRLASPPPRAESPSPHSQRPLSTYPSAALSASSAAAMSSGGGSLGEQISPTGLNLTLASFRKDQDSRAISRNGHPVGEGASEGGQGRAVVTVPPAPPVGAPVTTADVFTGVVGHSQGAQAPYSFPATNPHDLRYVECEVTSREFVIAQILQARAEAAREKKARERTLSPEMAHLNDAHSPLDEDDAELDDDVASRSHRSHTTAGASLSSSTVGRKSMGGESDASESIKVPASQHSQDGRLQNHVVKHVEESVGKEKEEDSLSDCGSPTAQQAMAAAEAREREKEAKTGKQPKASKTAGGKTSRHGVPRSTTTHAAKRKRAVRDYESAEKEPQLYSTKEKLWRRPSNAAIFFLLNSLQSPLSHMRLTAWQDRLTNLFQSGDQDLFKPDSRAQVKRQAKSELPDNLIVHLSAPASEGARGGGGGGVGERRRSMASHRSLAHGGGGGASASSSSQQSINLLRRLVLCLLLEENRSSQQLFSDIVELCAHLSRNALVRTVATNGGTAEGLQSMAAAVLAPTPSSTRASQQSKPGVRTTVLSEKERHNLLLLTDVLDVCVTAMVTIGCYAEATNYAMQRVHAQCLLEGDTTDVVCAAQRDLAEVLFFYGDFSAALQVAEDVLMLVEQVADTNCVEELEVKVLLVLSAVYSGKLARAGEVIVELMQLITDRDSPSGIPPITEAEILLTYALVHPAIGPLAVTLPPSATRNADGDMVANHRSTAINFSTESVLRALHEAVNLLSGTGDLAEMEKSFSMVAPAMVAALSQAAKVGGGGRDGALGAAVAAMGKQKRTRWNLLSFAAVLLLQNGEVDTGMALLESIIEELALGQHRAVERANRASLSAMLWVSLVTWKIWIHPTEARELLPTMKRTVQQLTRNRGPFHPLSATAHLLLADLQKSIPRSHALTVALRSLTALQRCVSPRSGFLSMAHTVCGNLATLSRRWRPSLEHANAALVISQMNNAMAEVRAAQESTLLGALLRCPSHAEVTLHPSLLLHQLEERLTSLTLTHGAHSESLVLPLMNLADAYFLYKDYDSALSCLQRALRLVDSKGTLAVSHSVLKPACQLNVARGDLERRRLALNALLQSPTRLLHIAALLFSMGAVLEARAGQGDVADAQDAYRRSLAVLETASLSGSLASVRIYEALAKSHYTTGQYADALSWALQAERAVHAHYKTWSLEVASARTLVATVQERLYEEEGTFVCFNPLPAQTGALGQQQTNAIELL